MERRKKLGQLVTGGKEGGEAPLVGDPIGAAALADDLAVEMLLYDLGYPRTPEERVGMLFWRAHRCARIIVSLKFHLGEMAPEEMVIFLVEEVGMEESGARGEVRRYIGDSYLPLYQCGYMLGGLQLRALYQQTVGTGKMSPRESHDAVLKLGPVPIEMVRATLSGEILTRNYRAS